MGETADKQARIAQGHGGMDAGLKPIHPAWRELMKLCESMGYGEIERLKVHDGLPVLAEVTRQKVRLIPS